MARPKKVKGPEATPEEQQAPAGMPLALEGPTAEHVLGLWNWKRKDPEEQGLRRYIRLVRNMTDLHRKPQIPKEYQAIAGDTRTPYMRDTWLRVAASVVKDTPVFEVEPRSEAVNDKRAASLAQRWLQAGFKLMDKERNMNTVWESARNLTRDSESVIKLVHRPDAFANFPVRDEQEAASNYNARVHDFQRSRGVRWPFAIRVVDRLNMYFGDGEYGDSWCLEYGQYDLPYLGATYGMTAEQMQEPTPQTLIGSRPRPYADDSPIGPTTTSNYYSTAASGRGTKWEYFDANWWTVVINGHTAPGFPRENPYAPWMPYFRATSEPVLYSLLYLVPELDDLLTMQKNWAYLSAFPVPVLESVATGNQYPLDGQLPAGDDGVKPKWKWSPGKLNVPPKGYKFSFMEPPPGGAALDKTIHIYQEMIDIAGVSSIFRGMSPGSRTPGYAINQLYAAAGVIYRDLGDALQRQMENAGEFLFHCVTDVINDAVFILAEGEE